MYLAKTDGAPAIVQLGLTGTLVEELYAARDIDGAATLLSFLSCESALVQRMAAIPGWFDSVYQMLLSDSAYTRASAVYLIAATLREEPPGSEALLRELSGRDHSCSGNAVQAWQTVSQIISTCLGKLLEDGPARQNVLSTLTAAIVVLSALHRFLLDASKGSAGLDSEILAIVVAGAVVRLRHEFDGRLSGNPLEDLKSTLPRFVWSLLITVTSSAHDAKLVAVADVAHLVETCLEFHLAGSTTRCIMYADLFDQDVVLALQVLTNLARNLFEDLHRVLPATKVITFITQLLSTASFSQQIRVHCLMALEALSRAVKFCVEAADGPRLYSLAAGLVQDAVEQLLGSASPTSSGDASTVVRLHLVAVGVAVVANLSRASTLQVHIRSEPNLLPVLLRMIRRAAWIASDSNGPVQSRTAAASVIVAIIQYLSVRGVHVLPDHEDGEASEAATTGEEEAANDVVGLVLDAALQAASCLEELSYTEKLLSFVRNVIAVHGLNPLFAEARIRMLTQLVTTLLPSRQDLEIVATPIAAPPADTLAKTVAADAALQLLQNVLIAAPHLRPSLVDAGMLQSLIQFMQTTPRTLDWFPVLLRVCDILQALVVDPSMTEHIRRVSQEYSAATVRPPGSLNSQVWAACCTHVRSANSCDLTLSSRRQMRTDPRAVAP
jgi:hypothetical protein